MFMFIVLIYNIFEECKLCTFGTHIGVFSYVSSDVIMRNDFIIIHLRLPIHEKTQTSLKTYDYMYFFGSVFHLGWLIWTHFQTQLDSK